jgi:hypothetical protein
VIFDRELLRVYVVDCRDIILVSCMVVGTLHFFKLALPPIVDEYRS